MDQNQLYTLVLGLVPSWMVDNVVFKVEEKRLDLQVTFPKGSRFSCLVCGAECLEHGVHQVPVSWEREGSHFTQLFEALIMTLVRAMPVLTAARLVRETDKRLWRIIDHYVETARTRVDMTGVHAKTPPALRDSPQTSEPTGVVRKRSRTSAWICLRPSRKGLIRISPKPR